MAEHYTGANTLEDRKEIGRKVAELRINSAGSKSMSWAQIREKLGLKHDEFHKVIRVEDHFQESVVERIESFEDGWEYNGKLEVLLGFEPAGELANRIEACKPKSALKRDNVVMVRIDTENLSRIDELVDSGQFNSRSEASAFLIDEGIKSKQQMFDKIAEKISQIQDLRTEIGAMIATDTKPPEIVDQGTDNAGGS